MNLVIDVGNTVVKAGIFKKGELVGWGEFATQPRKETDEWGILLSHWINQFPGEFRVKKVVISSVVSSIFAPLKKAIEKYFKKSPFEVTSQMVKIPLLCDNPQEIGADRLANAVAVCELYPLPAVVIDFGTATAFDVISERGEYLGGIIAPGIRSSLESLSEKAERLFLVEFSKPGRVIGKNTRDNLISGIFYIFLGGIKEILRRIEEELGREVKVIATGGLGILLGEECEDIDEVNLILTLQGLNIIAENWTTS